MRDVDRHALRLAGTRVLGNGVVMLRHQRTDYRRRPSAPVRPRGGGVTPGTDPPPMAQKHVGFPFRPAYGGCMCSVGQQKSTAVVVTAAPAAACRCALRVTVATRVVRSAVAPSYAGSAASGLPSPAGRSPP
ncbi:hypothetical protein AB0D32_10170 [Micromonospora sp. NPDC048170]|uniref:hypothetical protein n=1 Tax=Micromonospora sp. NPDC048170 TaxID=3154819 RepID=UPI0033C195E0